MIHATVIGHAYVAHDNQEKWRQLACCNKAEINLLLPNFWPSWEGGYRPESGSKNGLCVQTRKIFRAGREDQYVFFSRVGGLCKETDILHVEQGASAFVYTQSLIEHRLRRSKAKTCFFTWINWEGKVRWPWRMTETFNFRYSDGAIGGNRDAVDLLTKHGFRGKTAVIPQLGVDPEFYSPGDGTHIRQRLELKGVVIGFVGRLEEEKGIRLLLEVAQNIKEEVTFLFLGAGALTQEIKNWKGNESCHMAVVPAVPHNEVRDHLRAMDILVLPSLDVPHWREQFGHVLIEAMACEVPVIGSTAGAIPEVIGDAGLLFQQGKACELRESLQQWIASRDERRSYGQRGRKRVLENYTHSKIATHTLEFWKTLL